MRILWKLRQQRGMKMVLAYVTNVLVKMNMFRTRCILFLFAKTIEFVSWGNTFPFCFHLFLRTFQQPNPFCCNRSTTNLFMISFLSRTIDFFFFFLSLWISLWLAETSQQPISQTTWLKVTPHCNHCNHCTRHGKATSTEKPTNQITRIVTANNWAWQCSLGVGLRDLCMLSYPTWAFVNCACMCQPCSLLHMYSMISLI